MGSKGYDTTEQSNRKLMFERALVVEREKVRIDIAKKFGLNKTSFNDVEKRSHNPDVAKYNVPQNKNSKLKHLMQLDLPKKNAMERNYVFIADDKVKKYFIGHLSRLSLRI